MNALKALWEEKLCKLKNRKFRPVTFGGQTFPVLYNGRRVLIIDTKDDLDFSLGHTIVIIDKVMNLEMGWADQQSDGSYIGFTIYGPHELRISGDDLLCLAADTLRQHLWTMRN